jgi:large subunit ribosomal protein L9
MQVILKEKVANLGSVGDVVDVKPGFARNYLVPRGHAVRATPESITAFEKVRADLERQAEEVLAKAKVRLEKVEALTLTLDAQASDEGKLFGSVGPRDVADAAVAAGVELCKSEVKLPEGPIRAIGEFEVDIVLHSDVHGKLKIEVKAQES